MRQLLVVVVAVASSLLAAGEARAYPWMINHGYASCGACHVDPSGAGQMSAYGRAQQDLIVRWHLDPTEVESGEPSPTSRFLGFLDMPEWLNVSGNFRGGGMVFGSLGQTATVDVKPLLMASDVYGTVNLEWFVAHAELGFGLRLTGPADVIAVEPDTGNYALTSRAHWLGVRLFEDALTIRAGRIPVPFGLRNNEHYSWVRTATKSDINVHQTHGVAVSFANELFRGELMGIAGNFQTHPDDYRERGYAGYAELAPLPGLAIGASSRLGYQALDPDRVVPSIRHAHGAFGRWSPAEWFTLLGEAEATLGHFTNKATQVTTTEVGGVGWLQADIIPIGGVHLMPAVETLYTGDGTETLPGVGGWMSVAWYALPHTELRLDTLYRETFPQSGAIGAYFAMLQLHVFL